MAYPTVTVWTGGQLVGVTTLPQFNGTTGALTQSIQITNNSDVSLIFILERATPVTILPRYRLTAPATSNSQYSLSLAPSQTGSADTAQYVTLTESPDAVAFVLEPLNNNVNVTGGSVTITGTTSVNVANTPAVTLSGASNDVNVANTPTVNIGGTVTATITAGTVDIQNVANGILSTAGNLQYLGHFTVGAPNTLTLDPLTRAIIIIPDTPDLDSQVYPVLVQSHTFGVISYKRNMTGAAPPEMIAAYVNTAVEVTWDVTINNGFPGTAGYQVFADTALPVTALIKDGQQKASSSVPVVIASDQFINPTADSIAASGLGSMAGMLVDPATGLWDRPRTTYTDGISNTGVQAINLVMANPSGSYDRLRGSAANGLSVSQPVAAVAYGGSGGVTNVAQGWYTGPVLVTGQHILQSLWLAVNVRGTSPGVGVNSVTLAVTDGSFTFYLGQVICTEEKPVDYHINLGRIKPGGLNDAVSWTLEVYVGYIAGTATTDVSYGIITNAG